MSRKKTKKRVCSVSPPVPPSTLVTEKNIYREKLPPLLFTQQDLCDLMQISRSTLARIEKRLLLIGGAIPGRVLVGGSVRYQREAVHGWLSGRGLEL